ncbi:MAG: zf-HC2 domain-containing protein [Deltaproteobacteria bacterium]|jgi:anti-sigma factor RsiW
MKTCNEIREFLGAWLDGELDPSKAEAVRLHVAGCSACAEERRQLEKLQVAMKSVLSTEGERIAFEPFWRGVRERIGRNRPWHVEAIEWLRSALQAPGLVWAVPAMIVVVIVAFSLNSIWPRWGSQRNNYAAVESIDSHGRNVALLREDDTKTTVIWLYQNPEGENETSEEPAQSGPSF